MLIMVKKVKRGDVVVHRGIEEKVTDIRYHGFPKNDQGKSFMLTIQRGPHHSMFNETDFVQVR